MHQLPPNEYLEVQKYLLSLPPRASLQEMTIHKLQTKQTHAVPSSLYRSQNTYDRFFDGH